MDDLLPRLVESLALHPYDITKTNNVLGFEELDYGTLRGNLITLIDECARDPELKDYMYMLMRHNIESLYLHTKKEEK